MISGGQSGQPSGICVRVMSRSSSSSASSQLPAMCKDSPLRTLSKCCKRHSLRRTRAFSFLQVLVNRKGPVPIRSYSSLRSRFLFASLMCMFALSCAERSLDRLDSGSYPTRIYTHLIELARRRRFPERDIRCVLNTPQLMHVSRLPVAGPPFGMIPPTMILIANSCNTVHRTPACRPAWPPPAPPLRACARAAFPYLTGTLRPRRVRRTLRTVTATCAAGSELLWPLVMSARSRRTFLTSTPRPEHCCFRKLDPTQAELSQPPHVSCSRPASRTLPGALAATPAAAAPPGAARLPLPRPPRPAG